MPDKLSLPGEGEGENNEEEERGAASSEGDMVLLLFTGVEPAKERTHSPSQSCFLRHFIMKRWRFEEKLQLDKHSQRVEGAGD